MSGVVHLSLGGEICAIPRGQSQVWALTTGVEPYVGVFEQHREIVERIWQRAGAQYRRPDPRKTVLRSEPQPIGPLTLEIDGGQGPTVKIRGLYVIARMAGSDHINTEQLIVADRRWLWRCVPVERRYNVRRPTPEFRFIDNERTPLAVKRVEADLTFERMTLRNLQDVWKAGEVLEDVLAHLCGPGGYVIDLSRIRFQNPTQDLELHDQGPQAMARVLGEVPGVQVYAHPDGRIYLTDTLDQSEQAAFRSLAPNPIGGSWSIADRSPSLPRKVFVGVEREHEIRFDYAETDQTTATTTAKVIPGREEPTLQNVAPITDPSLTIGGKLFAHGTWMRILEDLIPAWNSATSPVPAVGHLNQAMILRHLNSGMAWPREIYRRYPPAEDPLLERRVGAVQEHYRRTFRVVPQWMDKLRFIAPRRASIVSPETGARARAEAYFNHTSRSSYLGLASLGQTKIGTAHSGYAADLADATPAPAEVVVLDPLVGIIQIVPRVSPTGVEMAICPGELDGEIPQLDAGANFVLWNQVYLKAAWNLSVVLTGVPSVPNDERRLWWTEVRLEDACKALGAPVPQADGPDRHVLCGDTVARFAWIDSQADAIKEAIWTGQRPPESLLTNPSEVRDVSVAQAARVVAPLLPRVVGRAQIGLDGSAVPIGNLRQVVHGVTVDGSGSAIAWTTLIAPTESAEPPSVYSLLPESTRKIVARLIEK